MTNLHVDVWGDGEPAVLVHGSGPSWGEETWEKQRPLADRYKLLLVDRRGFGKSPLTQRVDFAVDAEDIAELLNDGAHLVGSSYGGVVCLLAATLRPNKVRSLTVIEPPAFGIVRRDEAVENFISRLSVAYSKGQHATPEEFIAGFSEAFGYGKKSASTSAVFTEKDLKGIRSTMTERPPWEAEIQLDRLSAFHFPKLVMSGAWDNVSSSAREIAGMAVKAVCDKLEEKLRAKRTVFENASHNPQFQVPEKFNDQLRVFFESV